MRNCRLYLVLLILLIPVITISFVVPDEELDTEYVWKDEFSQSEVQKIQLWLDGVSDAVVKTFGSYRFPVKFYIHRINGREPVPWAETSRDGEQAVIFHVDPDYSLEEFQLDWTAPHEIAHLSIPFIGRSNMWFSEGYSSFWQWQILMEQELYSKKEIKKKYHSKMERIKPSYNTDANFIETSQKLLSQHNYPAVYWGGACYFFKVDALLKQNYNSSLKEVISDYQHDGRLNDDTFEDLIQSLDRISESKVFSEMLDTFREGSARDAVAFVTIDYIGE